MVVGCAGTDGGGEGRETARGCCEALGDTFSVVLPGCGDGLGEEYLGDGL